MEKIARTAVPLSSYRETSCLLGIKRSITKTSYVEGALAVDEVAIDLRAEMLGCVDTGDELEEGVRG